MSLCPVLRFGDPALARWYDRKPSFDATLVRSVAQTIEEVSLRGAEAVLEHTRRFDSSSCDSVIAEIPKEVDLPEEHQNAIRSAIERVTAFHEIQLETLTEGMTALGDGWGWRAFSDDERESGMVGQRLLPMASAGIYVPGGKAAYPSSVVMNVVPARVAGVQRIVVATPPAKDGSIPAPVLFACRELGVDAVLNAGGASAIAATALGIDGCDRVDVIAGPGNRYVNEAKRQLWGTVGLDSYAGPSEVCVVVDEGSDARSAALDLLTQIEHAEDNVAVLVGLSQASVDRVLEEVDSLLVTATRSASMVRALQDQGVAIVCETIDEACEAVNRFAPEHLALHVEDPQVFLQQVRNAGAVMMGRWTAQSIADYCEGPSHTLPTSGGARFASPVNVMTFLRLSSVSMLEQEDAAHLAPIAKAFGEMEGLPLHGQAADR